MKHQQKFLRWAQPRDRIGVFMRMRLGKTFSTIRWLKPKPADRILVLAPRPVLPGWESELKEEGESFVLLEGTAKQRESLLKQSKVRWFLSNPEWLRAHPEMAYDGNWDAVVLDESTFIRHPKAKISKICCTLFQHVRFKAILSGMPNPESSLDYFQQMKFLNGQFMGFRNFYGFRDRLCVQAGHDWILKRGVRDRIVAEVAESCFVMSEVQAGLNFKKVYEQRIVAMPPALRGVLKRAVKEFQLGESFTKWSVKVQNWMAQIAGGLIPKEYRDGKLLHSPHKVNELKYLLEGELKNEAVVVFFRFNREITLASKALKKAGIRHETLTGNSSSQERRDVVERFQKGKVRRVLCQGRLVRFGLNFSCANTAIFYSNHWDLETRDQCEARTQHPSKTEPTLYVDLITERSVDEAVLKALREKGKTSSNLLKRIYDFWNQG